MSQLKSNPTEGEKDMVSEVMAKIILQIQPLIEGKFLDSFDVSFELEGNEYRLTLKKQ